MVVIEEHTELVGMKVLVLMEREAAARRGGTEVEGCYSTMEVLCSL